MMKTQSPTRESILALLHSRTPLGNRAVERALIVLRERQTADEQRTEQTRHHNLRGFMPMDAPRMTGMANWVLSSYRPKGSKLTERQLAWLRNKPNASSPFPSRIGKYAAQLAKAAAGE